MTFFYASENLATITVPIDCKQYTDMFTTHNNGPTSNSKIIFIFLSFKPLNTPVTIMYL